MKRTLLQTILLGAAVLLATNAWAGTETKTVPVKMTYVDYNQPDNAMGEVDVITAGFNKAPSVGSTIEFGNTGWGMNYFGILKADVSSVLGTAQKVTLKAKVSGSVDSKRATKWGLALTDNTWSADLTYTTVSEWTVSALLDGGKLIETVTTSAEVFEEISFDITEAFTSGQTLATIFVYETASAGGYMKEAVVEVEYEPYDATSTTFTFEDSNNPFTDDSRITSAIEDDATLGSNVLGWTCKSNAQNGYSFSHYDFTSLLENPALVKLEFDYYNTKGGRSLLTIGDALVRGTTGGSSKTTYNKTGAVFRIGSDRNNAYINDIVFEQDVLCDKWLHVVVTANSDARAVDWVVTDQGGNEITSGSDNFYADDANACTQIDVFGYVNNSHCAMMDNLTITNYKSHAAFADYTVRYVDHNGNEIKESRTGNGQVGKYAKLMDSDKEPIYTHDYLGNSKKFIYESDDSETTPIAAEGTVITVTFREAEKYYAVLNCKAGSEILKQFRDLDNYWFWEGETYTLYPARYYKASDGSYWGTPATDWNGASFTFPGSISPVVNVGKTYYIGTLYYEKDETVAYYANFEDLALPVVDAGEGTGLGQLVGTVNNWWSFANGYFSRFSGGRGIRLDAGSYVWTEPIAEDGTYMVRIYGRNDKSANCEEPYALGYRDAEGNVKLFDVAVPDWGSATTGESVIGAAAAEATEEHEAVEASGIGIKAGWSLVVMNTGNGDMISLDDIKLYKVAAYGETPILLGPRVVYTEFVEETGTLTYYYDGQREKHTGITELYDPINDPDAVRFAGYYKEVTKVAIDPSMKRAPLTSFRNMSYGGYDSETWTSYNLPNVTSFEGLENLNTKIVTDMNSMFTMYSSLTELDLSSFNTSKVTNMNGMFLGCNKLKKLDLTSFDVSNVTDMRMMFGSCYELTTIYCNDDWSQIVPPNNPDNLPDNMYLMFSGCKKLVGGAGTPFDSNVTNGTYARPDGGTDASGYFTAIVVAPEDLVTEIYSFKGYDLYYKEDTYSEVQVGFYGENEVYIQGLSIYLPKAWVKGKLVDGTLTIPRTYLGIYTESDGNWSEDYDLFFSGSTFVYDAEAGTFYSEWGYVSYETPEDEYFYDEFKYVTLTKLEDYATTPADPEILEFSYLDNPYPYVKFYIPTVDVNGNPLIESKLAYQFYYYKENKMYVLVLTKDLYPELDADMSEIPYLFSQQGIVFNNYLYLNQPDQEIDSWHQIGLQSIYYGGGEYHSSNVVWFNNETADGIASPLGETEEGVAIYNVSGQRLNKMQKGINIVGGKKILVK